MNAANPQTTTSPPPGPPAPDAGTSDGGAVILQLYRAALRFTTEASANLVTSGGETVSTPSGVERAQRIVAELRASLDHNVAPDLCRSLDSLYEFVLFELDECQRDRSVAHLNAVSETLATLLEGWEEALGVPTRERYRKAS